jgi:hypothetical protein
VKAKFLFLKIEREREREREWWSWLCLYISFSVQQAKESGGGGGGGGGVWVGGLVVSSLMEVVPAVSFPSFFYREMLWKWGGAIMYLIVFV